ncbi:hypothetical protein HK105_203141 [Polyrhizophydium stewartii]|uniref:Uncharacterized protein n=1 Tax=Polyrhizophydium stewartii TaxID=2732419 RepID=A0ABR4ND75_9FUNG
MQSLELRIVFGVLFASRPEDIWTPAAKTRARIAIVVAHFALAWAEYFSGFASLVSTLRTIRIVGLVIHAVLLSLTSTVQAYLVISALLKTSKKISPDDSTARRRRLIFTMCFGSTAQLMAILSFGYVALFLKPNNLESQILYWLNDQFSAACIGIEAVSQTLSLLIMVDLVAGKPVAMGVTLMKRISQVAQRRTLKQEAYNDDSDMVFSAQAPHNTIAIPASTGIQPDTSSNE